MKRRFDVATLGALVVAALGGMAFAADAGEQPPSVAVEVSLDQPVRRLAGGLGASWHAIRREVPFDPKRMTSGRSGAPQGSGFGGNPPLDNTAAWQDLERHFRWLGLDWCRVEFTHRMYQPERDRFEWDNEEMRTLYRILDICESNRVDVFLTQMWNDVAWNAHDDVHPLQSAPRSVPDFARGLGELCERLLRQRRYTCIRWLCINNEPGIPDGWWLGPGRRIESITPALQAVRAELDRRGLQLPLSAPDFYTVSYIGKAPFDFDEVVGAFDAHTYVESPADYDRFVRQWVEYAGARRKPFFISEMGDFALGWQGRSEGPRLYGTQLSVARKVLAGLNLGVDGFSRWSFVNRGDLDGQFQLVRTWDMDRRAYLPRAEPEPVPYFAYGLLTRFQAKHSEVLKVTVAESESLVAAALRSPSGQVTVYLLNPDDAGKTVRLRLHGAAPQGRWFQYSVNEPALRESAFQLRPQPIALRPSANVVETSVTLPARSLSAVSTWELGPESPGVISDEPRFTPPRDKP
ncbi:MAG: hypothetical protein IPM17_16760 [Verrucomicrobia bacterium]|nr:hypothetical protein [Verrucomicrobiota bacterium]